MFDRIFVGWVDNRISTDDGGWIMLRTGPIPRVRFAWTDAEISRSRSCFGDVEFQLSEDSRGRLTAINVRAAVTKCPALPAKLTTGLHDRIERKGNHADA